jgi:hypothetical protein
MAHESGQRVLIFPPLTSFCWTLRSLASAAASSWPLKLLSATRRVLVRLLAVRRSQCWVAFSGLCRKHRHPSFLNAGLAQRPRACCAQLADPPRGCLLVPSSRTSLSLSGMQTRVQLVFCFWPGEETSLKFGQSLKCCPTTVVSLPSISNSSYWTDGCEDEKLILNVAVVANKCAFPRPKS